MSRLGSQEGEDSMSRPRRISTDCQKSFHRSVCPVSESRVPYQRPPLMTKGTHYRITLRVIEGNPRGVEQNSG